MPCLFCQSAAKELAYLKVFVVLIWTFSNAMPLLFYNIIDPSITNKLAYLKAFGFKLECPLTG